MCMWKWGGSAPSAWPSGGCTSRLMSPYKMVSILGLRFARRASTQNNILPVTACYQSLLVSNCCRSDPAQSATPRFPTYSFLPKVETFFIPEICLWCKQNHFVFFVSCWQLYSIAPAAPWIWIVCFTQSFEIEIVVRRTA